MATTILPTYNYTTGANDAIPASLPMANAYQYDQLNRIAQSNSFTNFDATANAWKDIGAIPNMYLTKYVYDANGNIKNLQRSNAAGVKFDDMTYQYDNVANSPKSNKLYHVNDAITNCIHTADIDDKGVFQNSNNITIATVLAFFSRWYSISFLLFGFARVQSQLFFFAGNAFTFFTVIGSSATLTKI